MKQIDFQKKYGFEKPRKDQMLVVYCKAGVRAQKAMDIAKQLGYPQVRNYRGSWLDWTSSQ
jgi:3-mercaptopyruvate sulfurtransferase SseA